MVQLNPVVWMSRYLRSASLTNMRLCMTSIRSNVSTVNLSHIRHNLTFRKLQLIRWSMANHRSQLLTQTIHSHQIRHLRLWRRCSRMGTVYRWTRIGL
jgi:hypothetical protein